MANKFANSQLRVSAITALIIFFCLNAPTLAVETSDDEPIRSNGFYTIDDTSVLNLHAGFQSPFEVLSDKTFQPALAADKLTLTHWFQHSETLPTPAEKYNRKKHFAGWQKTDTTCQNTRAKVLIRDSKKQVTFTNPQNCVVATGEWDDPYTGQVYTSSKDIQIDHVVPLKHSYDMGGWQWTQEKRCLYENYVSNDFHLLSVNGPENMKKGAASPDVYMPPNPKFAWQYLQTWLMIKTIWDLPLNIQEGQTIGNLIKDNNCSAAELQVPIAFIKKQRQDILNQKINCQKSAPDLGM